MSDTVPFRDLRRLLESRGWELTRINGSHHIFRGPGGSVLSIPVHKGQVKRVYRRKIEKALEQSSDGLA